MNKQKIIQIGQWLAIIVLSIACFYFWMKTHSGSVVTDTQYKKSDMQYVNISSDKSLSELKKENKVLYDSIKKLSDVKEAIQIKYITKYNTDTIKLIGIIPTSDSTYHYSHSSDTIKYKLDINGNKVKWFKLDFAIQDSLMIVTRSKNGKNETLISNGSNTEIQSTTVYIPKKTFLEKLKDKTYFGIGVGAGYGFFSKKPDIYIGINAGINF